MQPNTPHSDTDESELRDKLIAIVTRNGKTGRIPELLEDEMVKLEALIEQQCNQAALAALGYVKSKGHDWDDINEGTVFELNKYIAELQAKETETE